MKLPALIVCAAIFTACRPTTPTPTGPLTATGRPWADFTPVEATTIKSLEERIEKLAFALMQMEHRKKAAFIANLDPTSKGFSVIETTLGIFALADIEAVPYLDGYSVRFKIGNLLSAPVNGFKANVWWGPSFRNDTTNFASEYAANQKAWRTNHVTLPELFVPGTWTSVELKIAPADAATIRNLNISLDVESINLRESKSKP